VALGARDEQALRMTPQPMFIVTEVAPYETSPAGVHGVLGQAATALSELAAMTGLEPVRVAQVGELSSKWIAGGGVLALFNIGKTPWSDDQRRAILSAVRGGGLSVLAVHSATDASSDWPEYGSLVGARFDGHPWTTDFVVDVEDRVHPSTKHLGESFGWSDEVYTFRDLRPDARVLLRVADGQLDMGVDGAHLPECGFPLAWCFEEEKGRCFYTSLGHFPRAWETPDYLRHLEGGLGWVLRRTG
jgi:uncharacterized protein